MSWDELSEHELLIILIKLALITVVAFFAGRLLRLAMGRTITSSVRRAGEGERVEARAHALATVARSVVTIVVWSVAVFYALQVLGIDVGPLIAGAGIVGVALGFGAQNIVADFLAGFFIVSEDQFGVGDWVDLGEAEGRVEKVSLRSTRLRDVDGVVWHVPNGKIDRVANQSQEWAQARLDFAISYSNDLDAALSAIDEVAMAFAADPDWAPVILEAPEVWGVQDLTADGVTVRIVMKTKAAAQFGILRELRRRLKNDFDERGLDMPGGFSIVHLYDRTERDEGHGEKL